MIDNKTRHDRQQQDMTRHDRQQQDMIDNNNKTLGLPFGIGVQCGHHLGEVNDCRVVLRVEEDVELVEVAMNEPVPSQLHYQLHQLAVHHGGLVKMVHLTTETTTRRSHHSGGVARQTLTEGIH